MSLRKKISNFLKPNYSSLNCGFMINPYSFATAGGGIGGWVELGRTTLGSASDTISVTGLTNKRYLMILGNTSNTGGTIQNRFRLGNGSFDSGTSYATRFSRDGGADSAIGNDTSSVFSDTQSTRTLMIGYMANYSTKEKLGLMQNVHQNTAGAGNAPNREEDAFKWTNTSNVIERMQLTNINGSGDYESGSELVVLGYDPSDTHTTNFWEELASVELSSPASSISSGTFTAKKYLWVQAYAVSSGSVGSTYYYRFNGDSGNNYAERSSSNGAADGTSTSSNVLDTPYSVNVPIFTNMFIVNNSANEKLIISHMMNQNTAGAGNVPNRSERVCKWANTSNQITSIVLHKGADSISAGSILKVWGSN